MENITLTVNKADVYDEVAKTTSYVGAKSLGDGDAAVYDRMFVADADRTMLERFWTEACNGATEMMKRYVVSVSDQSESREVAMDKDYSVTLAISERFDTALRGGMETSLFSYFVNAIVAKWFRMTNRTDAEAYATDAASCLMDVESKMYHRKAPVRKEVKE